MFPWKLVPKIIKQIEVKRFISGKKHNLLPKMYFNYPEVRKDETVKDNHHGTEIADPYRWLEDPFSEETKKFVEAQNAVTVPYLNSCPYREKIRKCITELWDYPKVAVPHRHGKKYFQSKNTGLQNQSVVFIKDSLYGEEKVFIDPNTLSKDGTIALVSKSFSEDGKTFAYGLSESGSDWVKIKFRDVETGKDYDDVLEKVKFSSATWLHDNKGVFYGAYLDKSGRADGSETEAVQNQKLYYHKIGTKQSEDFVVAEFDDPELRIQATVSHCGNYLILSPIKGCKNNLLYIAHLKDSNVTGKLELTPIVTTFESDYEYVTNNDNLFIFQTNNNAANYKIIIIDYNDPDPSKWKDLIPEHPKDVLNFCIPINNNNLVVCYLRDVKSILQLCDLNTGKLLHDFNIDLGAITSISGKREHTEMFYSFASFLIPTLIYRVDFSGGKVKTELIHTTKVGQIDTDQFETHQVFYPSKDGTKIPMFIVNKKGLVKDGTKPCLLYAYGGFNINLVPSFSVSNLIFVNNFGGVFAVANIRGGGEYGDKWHNGGRFENKQNCFDDFQFAAKYLVEQKYTKPEKLTIKGGSNGGLLVAACINQAPELFGAAICQVGVLDMLRYHKFTIGYAWKTDYGCADIPDEFKYIYKYSPLHNIKVPENGQYPATLLLTADHDDRVVPLHSLKFIAELQHTVGSSPKQTNPLMIRIETRAGHGAGKPTAKIIEELCDIFCFMSKALNLEFIS